MHEDFKKFVMEKIKENDTLQLVKRKGEIEVTPDFFNMFKQSDIFASMLLNSSFRTKQKV